VERLAALLRFSLDSNLGKLTPLRRELKIVTDYLEIERAQIRPSIGSIPWMSRGAPGHRVHPMSIQTLVENS